VIGDRLSKVMCREVLIQYTWGILFFFLSNALKFWKLREWMVVGCWPFSTQKLSISQNIILPRSTWIPKDLGFHPSKQNVGTRAAAQSSCSFFESAASHAVSNEASSNKINRRCISITVADSYEIVRYTIVSQ
jgi:hypothetical protein